MSLHLISMLINTSEEVSSTMHIQHDSAALVIVLLARVVVAAHLDPFSLELHPFTPPLPPFASANLIDTFVAELLDQDICSLGDLVGWYRHRVDLDPPRMRYPLRRECLEFLDSVMGGMIQE
jgi:hypothetical protein